jgi:hypothetical protein
MVVAEDFAVGIRAVLISNGQHGCIGNLRSEHEEADTHIVLHVKDASNTHSRIVIHSSDTAVCVLCVDLYQETNCHEVWFRTGIRDKLCFIPCYSVASNIVMGCAKRYQPIMPLVVVSPHTHSRVLESGKDLSCSRNIKVSRTF